MQAKKNSFCSHFFFFFPRKSLERCFQKFVVVAHRFTDGVGVVRRGQLGGRWADFNPELEVRVPFWLLLFQHLGCLAVGQPPVGRDGVTRDVTLDVGVTHLASVLSSFFSSEPLRLCLNKLEWFFKSFLQFESGAPYGVHSLTYKYWSHPKKFSFVQHSSLFCHAVSDEEEVFYDTGTWKWTRGLVSSQP